MWRPLRIMSWLGQDWPRTLSPNHFLLRRQQAWAKPRPSRRRGSRAWEFEPYDTKCKIFIKWQRLQRKSKDPWGPKGTSKGPENPEGPEWIPRYPKARMDSKIFQGWSPISLSCFWSQRLALRRVFSSVWLSRACTLLLQHDSRVWEKCTPLHLSLAIVWLQVAKPIVIR